MDFGRGPGRTLEGNQPMNDDAERLRALYLDLIEEVIINRIYRDPSQVQPRNKRKWDPTTIRDIGRDLPSVAHSMIGKARMANIRACAETALREGIPGDFIETGVWRGGACIYMRAILKAWGIADRRVWVADSFAGLPPPDAANYPQDAKDKHHLNKALAISRQEVEENFRRYGLLDDQVRFLVGWFKDTLPAAPVDAVALLRLDGDMYESTMDGFRALYHKVPPGGFIIVDDYGAVPRCRAAVHDFLDQAEPGRTPKITEIDWTGVYWRKPG